MTQAERNKKWKQDNPEKYKQHQRNYKRKYKTKLAEQRTAYRTSEDGRKKQQDYRLKKTYGISLAEYEAMFQKQGGLCFICHKPETRTVRGRQTLLVVDHNHACCSGPTSCGKCVRKLLCHACNVSIGLLEENPDRMRQAAIYVELFSRND